VIHTYEDEHRTGPIKGTLVLETKSIGFKDYSGDYIVSHAPQVKDMLLIFMDEYGNQYEFPVVPRDGKWLTIRETKQQ
jgi:hypothetical protein